MQMNILQEPDLFAILFEAGTQEIQVAHGIVNFKLMTYLLVTW